MPMVLGLYSDQEVALWLWLLTFSSLTVVGDIGFSQTFARAVAYAKAGADVSLENGRLDFINKKLFDNKDSLKLILRAMGPVYLLLSALYFLLISMAGTYAVSGLVESQSDVSGAWFAWCFVVVGGVISLWGNCYVSFLMGRDRIAEIKRNEIFISIAGLLCCATLVFSEVSIAILVLAQQIFIVTGVLINYFLCRKEGDFNLSIVPLPGLEALRAFWSPAWRSGLGILMGYGIIQVAGLLYARLVEVSDAAAFLLAWRLIQVIVQISQPPFYSQIPLFNRMKASGEDRQLVSIASYRMKISLWVYVCAVLCVYYFHTDFLALIGSNTGFVDSYVWAVISVAFFVERLGGMYMQLYSTSNKIIWHKANGLTGVSILCLIFFIKPMAGVSAIPVAILISYLCVYYPIAVISCTREFGFDYVKKEMEVAALPLFILTALLFLR